MHKAFLFAVANLLLSVAAQAEIKGYSCIGTEPFYAVELNAATKRLTYRAPENQKGVVYRISGPIQAQGLQEATVMVFKNPRADISATVISSSVAGKCSNGMSQNEYAYHLVYNQGKTVKYGCCEPLAQD